MQRNDLLVRLGRTLFRTTRIAIALAGALHCVAATRLTAQAARPAASPVSADSQPKDAWLSVGPDGGDARSLAADPQDPLRLYLGTETSWIYSTEDGGKSWHRLARLNAKNDLLVDNLIVNSADSKTLLAGVYEVDGHGGGVYLSHDSGRHWVSVPSMDGQSVRALTQAASNSKIFVAGTLSGVYRSTDGGEHWTPMSPAGSTELHEIESVAIDPADPNTVYAGTWHLPWKTTDGGAHWANITKGLIDDSDVFSIIIDPHTPAVVYASACSGIYKSETAGELFRKVQGIPSTARRTRVLMQDPRDPNVVYAGTTEGLYKTSNAGTDWVRLTGPDVIINDVFVDPADDQRLLLATDRSGVLASEDGGKTFASANQGFSQRFVQTLLVDAKRPGTLYAGVLNDKSYGGAFVSKDEGVSWQQVADGLDGRDVFVLAQADDGGIYAGTNNGIAHLVEGKWQAVGDVITHATRKVVTREHKHRVSKSVDTVQKVGLVQGNVVGLALQGSNWYAATAKGIYSSTDRGENWQLASVPPGDYRFIAQQQSRVFAGQRTSLLVSGDAGRSWKPVPLPAGFSSIAALALSADGVVWIGGRQGLYSSKDSGETWQPLKNLPLGAIDGLDYDPALQRVLVSSRSSSIIFAVDASGSPWKYWQVGWLVHQVLQQGDRLAAASLFDGVVLEPSKVPEKVDEHGTLATPGSR